jgi:hypothetical protein
MKKIDINLFVICCFLGIALTILYIHTSTNQNTEFSVLEISPISGLEQKQANLDGTDYTLTSKTAIIKSAGFGSYLLTIKPPSCSPYNSSNVSLFPSLREDSLKEQTENSWSIDSRGFNGEMYLVIQTIGSSCSNQGDNASIFMEINLTASN